MFDVRFIQNFYFPESFLLFLQQPILATLSLTLLDGWSFIHILAGFVLAAFIKDTEKILGALVFFEILELGLVQQGLAQPENIIEQGLDVIYGLMGMIIYKKIKPRRLIK